MNNKLKMADLSKFFMPMAAMAMIMKASHNIINYALGQTPDTALALTSYSVAFSVSTMIMAPIWVLSKATTAVAHNRKSAKNSLRVAWQAAVLVVGIMLIIAFTPANKFVFCDLMGVSDEVLPHVLSVFKVFILLPLFGAIRATHQSFIALRRKTIWLTIGTIIRIIGMFLLTTVIINFNLVKGSYIGALILVIGFGTEGLVWLIKGRSWLKEAPEVEQASEDSSLKNIWILLLPLVVAQLINGFVNTGISAGLLRTPQPEVATSAYFLSRSIAWIFLAVSFSASQMVLVFVKKHSDWLVVKRFVSILSLVMASFIGILAFTPLGMYVFTKLLNVEVALANQALKSLAIFTLTPPAMFIVELYQAILIKSRQSKKITICKVLNIVVLITITFSLVKVAPHLGGMIGSISFTLAFYFEALVSFLLSKKHIHSQRDTETVLSRAV